MGRLCKKASYRLNAKIGISTRERATIRPKVSEMKLGASSLAGASSGSARLIKGCPCYREFGDEKVCLNNDDVLPIISISVDPSFFSESQSPEDLLKFKSSRKNMCYLLVFLDETNDKVYCVSQGQRIRINKCDVKSSDVLDALQFVTSTEQSSDGVVCSDCLYKYLIMNTEVFADRLSETERREIISAYVKNLAVKMATDLEEVGEETVLDEGVDPLEHVENSIKDLMKQRSEWASRIDDLKKEEASEDLIELMEHYKLLARLETVFLFQVITLSQAPDQVVSLGILKFMVEVAGRVVSLNNEIREKSHKVMETGGIPNQVQQLLEIHSDKRRRTEHRFSNLLRALSQIRT